WHEVPGKVSPEIRPVGYGVTGFTATGWWRMGIQKNAKRVCTEGHEGLKELTLSMVPCSPERHSLGMRALGLADPITPYPTGRICWGHVFQALRAWLRSFSPYGTACALKNVQTPASCFQRHQGVASKTPPGFAAQLELK